MVKREQIYIKQNGELFIHPEINGHWLVRIPTNKNGLKRNASCSLKLTEYKYDLPEKDGILFVDMRTKQYVFIPNYILKDHPPEGKTFMGMKNSLFVFDIGLIIEKYHFTINDIPVGAEPKELQTGLAGDIRKRFGL